MPDQLQLRGGTTAQNNAFTGAAREVTVDTTKDTLIVHDATTAGGNPLMREDGANSALINGSVSEPALAFAGDSANTGIYSPGTDQLAVSTNGVERVEWGTSEVVFNDGGENYDFRVEGDTNANVLFVDASLDRVGIGTGTPSAALSCFHATNNTVATFQSGDSVARATFIDPDGEVHVGAEGDNIVFATSNLASEQARIDSSGRLLVGTGTTSEITTAVFQGNSSSATSAASIYLQRGAEPTGTQDFGSINFADNDGDTGAWIIGERDSGTWTAGSSHPGALSFGTTADGDASPTQRMRITRSGDVGIGTGSPTFTSGSGLEIARSGTACLRIEDEANSKALEIYIDSTGTTIDSRGTSARTNFAIGGNSKMLLDNSGRLLIGTTSAEGFNGLFPQLQVEGTDNSTARMSLFRISDNNGGPAFTFAKARNTSHKVLQADDYLGQIDWYGSDGTDTNQIGARISARIDGTPGSNDLPGRLEFFTTADGASSPTERMRIANNGAIGLNYISPAYSTEIKWATSDPDTRLLSLRSDWQASSQVQCRVFTDGDVENRNNSYGAISDAKLKENIVDANSQWNDIKDLRVRNYNFIASPEIRQIGVVAQEVELVSPGLVANRADEDEQGNDLGTVTKTVNYSVLYMKAVKALQEAMERIETLEAKVAALEAN